MPTSTFDKKIVLSKQATEKFLKDFYNSNNSANTSIDIAKVLHKNQEEQKKWLSDWMWTTRHWNTED